MFIGKPSVSRQVFNAVNAMMLTFVCALIVIPLWNIIITSMAQDKDVMGNVYLLVPKSFNLSMYVKVFNSGYMRAFNNSMIVAFAGTITSMLITLPMGYSLAQKNLVARNFFIGMIVIPMMFDAGMIPFYVVVKSLKLINTFAALIIPVALSSFNLIVMKNYIQSIPESLIESARLDGCSEAGILARIVVPVSIPIIAAVTLFYFVSYWNMYFVVIMFINDSRKYTLQVVLRTLIFEANASVTGNEGIYSNFKMAVMIMGMLPVLILYPFIQRYFISGLMLGSIKG